MSWVQCRPQCPGFDSGLLLIAIGLQSLSMKICMLQSPLFVRAKREVLVDLRVIGCWSSFSMDWVRFRFFRTLFISFLFKKKTFCSSSLFVRAKRQVLLGSFSGVRGSNAGADKIIYQIFELCNFSKSGLFERAQVQMPMSPGSGFDARELLGLFLNVIERR